MKRVKRAFCVILSLLLFSAGAGKFQTVTYASELTNDSIREKEAEINRAKKEKNELQSGLTDVKAIKKELESAKAEAARPFAMEAELQRKSARLAELDAALNLGGRAGGDAAA